MVSERSLWILLENNHHEWWRKEAVRNRTSFTLLPPSIRRTRHDDYGCNIRWENYDLWERDVRTSLKSKNKLAFTEGKLTRPKDENDEGFSEAQAWDMINSMLCSWLFNIIHPKLRLNVAYSDTAKIMWDDLKKRYAMANTPKIHQLKADIANCK